MITVSLAKIQLSLEERKDIDNNDTTELNKYANKYSSKQEYLNELEIEKLDLEKRLRDVIIKEKNMTEDELDLVDKAFLKQAEDEKKLSEEIDKEMEERHNEEGDLIKKIEIEVEKGNLKPVINENIDLNQAFMIEKEVSKEEIPAPPDILTNLLKEPVESPKDMQVANSIAIDHKDFIPSPPDLLTKLIGGDEEPPKESGEYLSEKKLLEQLKQKLIEKKKLNVDCKEEKVL